MLCFWAIKCYDFNKEMKNIKGEAGAGIERSDSRKYYLSIWAS